MNEKVYSNDELKELLTTVIEDCTRGLPGQILWYTKYNQPHSIIDQTLSEVMHAAINQTLCGGTGGGGWDHVDNGENKNSSYVQAKFCGKCDKKVTFFTRICPHCDSKNFKARKAQKDFITTNPRDARWGIGAKTHFEHYEELKEYRLSLIEPTKDEPDCRKFRIRSWKINKDSEHLNLYAKAQLESPKSNHINFQPLSADFYLSGPILVFDGILEILEDSTKFTLSFFDINNDVPEEIPGEYKDISSEEHINKKGFGKERGEWVRN